MWTLILNIPMFLSFWFGEELRNSAKVDFLDNYSLSFKTPRHLIIITFKRNHYKIDVKI